MDDDPSGVSAELRKLPQVGRLSDALPQTVPAPLRVEAARTAIAQAGAAIRSGGGAPRFDELAGSAAEFLRRSDRSRLTKVINATGVLLHTNLGRAPLGREALAAVERIGGGYSNLEYDLEKSSRGSRYDHAAALVKAVTGAESALVVNNNAAAVLLALSAVAKDREVIVSRGELIEIGGEFRIPEIMAQSGAVMREIGTTNRTHLKDYEDAISPSTAAVIKVHPSNYRVVGFTSSVPAAEVARLCARRGLVFIHDVGSGLLRRRIGGREPAWLAGEPSVADAVSEGAGVVTFSGDKLLGGPQSGILAGEESIVSQLRISPLLRAFRVDKTTLAALEATLSVYLEGREAELPLWRMALADPEELVRRSEALIAAVESSGRLSAKMEVIDGFSTPGGGSAPGSGIPTALVKVHAGEEGPDQIHRALVLGDPPVIGRVDKDALLLDLRTVDPGDDERLSSALTTQLTPGLA